MTGHVQSASGKFLVPPVTVFTAIGFPVGVQVEAAQSAKYPLHVWKSKTLSGPAARAVSGANKGAPQSGRILPLRTCCRLRLMCAFPPSKVNAFLNFGFLRSRVAQPARLKG
jgi:hypothetical protein